jgi:excisionase family DNA binding protein
MTTQDGPRLALTVEDMCRELGISKPHGFRMIREGKIPAIHLGRRWIISRKALEELLTKPNQE